MATDIDLVPGRGSKDPEFAALRQITEDIVAAKQDITGHFRTIGSGLKRVRAAGLFGSAGLHSFEDYLALPAIDFTSYHAQRLIQLAEAQDLQALLPLGVNKIVELLRLPPEHRQKLLSGPVEVAGGRKSLPQMSLAELRQVARDWRHAGRTRCNRCGRWVQQVKEVDGRFYGSDGPQSCYDKEMVERRALTEHPIPAPQLDTVLDCLQSAALSGPVPGEKGPARGQPLSATLDGFLHLYAQLLHHADAKRPSAEEARAESRLLQQAIRLFKVRLQELGRTED